MYWKIEDATQASGEKTSTPKRVWAAPGPLCMVAPEDHRSAVEKLKGWVSELTQKVEIRWAKRPADFLSPSTAQSHTFLTNN